MKFVLKIALCHIMSENSSPLPWQSITVKQKEKKIIYDPTIHK